MATCRTHIYASRRARPHLAVRVATPRAIPTRPHGCWRSSRASSEGGAAEMWIFPSREIHLVRAAQPNTVALRVFVQEPANRKGAWTDASTSTHTVEFDPIVATGKPPSMPTLHGA